MNEPTPDVGQARRLYVEMTELRPGDYLGEYRDVEVARAVLGWAIGEPERTEIFQNMRHALAERRPEEDPS